MVDDVEADWLRRAACRGEDPSSFFAPAYFEKRGEKLAREAVAKRLCAVCPVADPCLAYALETREAHGVWGGLNETERRALLRRRPREAS
jgi:WhiB family redox-sensing transcriptional regulator